MRSTLEGFARRAVDQVGARTGAGPCIVAMQHLSAVLVEDIETGTRRPTWHQAATAARSRSAAALPADVSDTVAFTMYVEEAGVRDSCELLDVDGPVQDLAAAMRIGPPR